MTTLEPRRTIHGGAYESGGSAGLQNRAGRRKTAGRFDSYTLPPRSRSRDTLATAAWPMLLLSERSEGDFMKVLLAAALLAVALVAVNARSSASPGPVAQINTECNAIQNAVMALHPIHVAYRSGNWVVMSDADYTVAERTKASITFADVYKQGSKYAWVHAHSFDSSGRQRATQLCFRQSDGTLERARQATTVPSLAAASAQQAYYTSSGKSSSQKPRCSKKTIRCSQRPSRRCPSTTCYRSPSLC